MSDTTFESVLAGQLRAYAEAGVRPIDRFAIASATIATGRTSLRRRWLIPARRATLVPVLVGLLLLALVAGALVAGTWPKTPPTTPLPTAPAVIADPTSAVPTGYVALFLRPGPDAAAGDIDIVASRPDGRERTVRHLLASTLGKGRFEAFGAVSQDGWLSVEVAGARWPSGNAWALIDLTAPSQDLRFVPFQPLIGGAWSPNGIFATLQDWNAKTMVVVDARTDTSHTLPLAAVGGGPDFFWAADGSGLVGNEGSGLGIQPIDGTAFLPGVPALAPTMGGRWLPSPGAQIQSCSQGVDGIVTVDRGGAITTWVDDGLGSVVDCSLSADGRSVWILLDSLVSARHSAVIAIVGAAGHADVVGRVDLGSDSAGTYWMAFAPDDSLIAVGDWRGQPSQPTETGRKLLMDTRTGATTSHTDRLIGFVPASVVPADTGTR